MSPFRSARSLVLTLLVAPVLVACSQGSDTATPSSGAEPASGATKSASEITVGYAGPTLTNAFFVGLQKGVQDGAKEFGFKLVETNANGDAAQQVNDAINLLSQDIDALVLTPIDSNGITPAVEKANEMGVPVFTLDRGSDGGKVTSFVETDNVAAGQQAAEWIGERMTERYGKASGKVVNLQGLIGTTAAASREKGFQAGLAALPELDEVASQEGGFDQEKSLNAMTNILQAEPEIDAVFGANDDNTVGALRAIDGAGRYAPAGDDKHIFIIGLDGTAQALDAIREGKQDATISQNPIRMAQRSLGFVNDLLVLGKEVPAKDFWPTILIDAKNIDSAEVKEYGLWSAEVS